jgi:hypothetical protein
MLLSFDVFEEPNTYFNDFTEVNKQDIPEIRKPQCSYASERNSNAKGTVQRDLRGVENRFRRSIKAN